MTDHPTIKSLKEQRTKVMFDEGIWDAVYKQVPKLERALENKENISYWFSAPIVIISVLLFDYCNYNTFSWNVFWGTVGFLAYPGFIATIWVGLVITEFIHWPIHLFYGLSEKNYKIYKKRKRELAESKDKINVQIAQIEREEAIEKQKQDWIKKRERDKENEISLLKKLNDLVIELTNSRITKILAEKYKIILEQEHQAIKSTGYQVEKNITFTNLFKKIDRLINPTSITTTTSATLNSALPVSQPQPPPKSTPTETKPKDEKPIQTQVPKSTQNLEYNDTNQKVPTAIPNPVKEGEHSVKELFGEAKEPEQVIYENNAINKKDSIKIDFAKLNEHRHNIGELGELYAFEKEQNYLISKGKIRQSKEVIHISTQSDSEGYDIISFTDGGDRKFIEVKTTTGNQYEPFYLSTSEMEAMKRLNNYWIYRIYNFNIHLKKGDLYKIDCSKELETHYHIKASSFKVSPKL